MNRGVVERSPVQQMTTAATAGNSNRWSMSNMISSRPTSAQIVTSFSAPPPPPTDVILPRYTALPPPSSTTFWVDDNQQLPAAESISWSQLLLGGLVEENDNRKSSELTNLVQTKKGVENWEDVFLHQQQSNGYLSDARQLGGYSTNLKSFFMYSHENINEEYQTSPLKSSWLPPAPAPMPVSPPASCVTTLNSSNHLSVDLTGKMSDGRRPPLDHSSECNSTGATAGANKKARVQPSSTQSTFKVRKEKLGDRITALHQLVSPFGKMLINTINVLSSSYSKGYIKWKDEMHPTHPLLHDRSVKTDTASVLLEAIGYIRFLQSQVEALSVPYMGKTSSGLRQQQNVRKTVRKQIIPTFPNAN